MCSALLPPLIRAQYKERTDELQLHRSLDSLLLPTDIKLRAWTSKTLQLHPILCSIFISVLFFLGGAVLPSSGCFSQVFCCKCVSSPFFLIDVRCLYKLYEPPSKLMKKRKKSDRGLKTSFLYIYYYISYFSHNLTTSCFYFPT